MIALITNAIEPYAWDIARLLALPVGQRYRFRYKKHYVHVPDAEKIRNAKAIVVVRDFDTGQLIPLLGVTIQHVLPFGEVLYFEMTVGELCSDHELTEITRELNKVLVVKQLSNPAAADLGALVLDFDCDNGGSTADNTSIAERWDAAVERLGRMAWFKGFNFLRVIRVSRIGAAADGAGAGVARALRPDAGYVLEVLQKISQSSFKQRGSQQPFQIRISGEEGVKVIAGSQSIVGEYDVVRFSFRTNDASKASIASLVLAPGSLTGGPTPRAPDLVLQFDVTPTWLMAVMPKIKALTGALGLVGTMFVSKLAAYLASRGLPVSEDVLSFAFLLLVVVSYTGAYTEVRNAFLGKAPDMNL